MRAVFGTGAALALSAFAALGVAPGPAGAQTRPAGGAGQVVFVQTDNPGHNQVVAYDRTSTGTLSLSRTYDTDGQGGLLNGSAVDHLASQGSLAYDPRHSLLYAVNAGSDSVSVFTVNGDRLRLRQVVDSGGTFPVSIAVNGDLVYVLNALDGASVTGYRVDGRALHPIGRSTRSLGLDIPSDRTQFTHTPGQVAFSPDGSHLIVTTKMSGNDIDVFSVRNDGRLSGAPVVTAQPGTVPFAVAFDARGRLLVTQAGPNALARYRLNPDGSVSLIESVATGQAATCWVAEARGFFFASNAGGASVSAYQDRAHGPLTLLGATATDTGTVDASAPAGAPFLYVQTGANGIVDEFHVSSAGTLTPIGSVTVPGAVGGEGIVAL
jgi:hypothetical protein